MLNGASPLLITNRRHSHALLPTRSCIATRGSALALAQANLVLAQCRAAFPS